MRLLLPVLGLIMSASQVCAAQSSDTDLRNTVRAQRVEIEELRARLDRLEKRFTEPTAVPALGDARSGPADPAVALAAAPVSVAPQPQPQIAAIRFSGDFRLRLDAAFRSASTAAPGLQNVRQRYRLRLNADRDVASDLKFHMQLATGAVNNGITFDQDFAGGVTRHPFFISEAFVTYEPNTKFSVSAGKVQEVYADNFRFLWDDDVRFNGFNERARFGNVEVRAGQYFFVNPNAFSVANTSPLVLAGEQPGAIARASQMFHQGITHDRRLNERWRQELTADVQLYRKPNLIALTSIAAGPAVTTSPAVGLAVSGPAPGAGNATVAPASAILHAARYQVARLAYRLDANRIGSNPKLPFTWILQASRNVGTSQLRDAVLTSVILGRSAQKGDVRGQYMFSIKDANSLIGQLTDDDLGTGIGVNLATHHVRVDYNLRSNVIFQNLLFLQNSRRNSNAAAGFHVPIGRAAPRTWRYQGQLAISF